MMARRWASDGGRCLSKTMSKLPFVPRSYPFAGLPARVALRCSLESTESHALFESQVALDERRVKGKMKIKLGA